MAGVIVLLLASNVLTLLYSPAQTAAYDWLESALRSQILTAVTNGVTRKLLDRSPAAEAKRVRTEVAALRGQQPILIQERDRAKAEHSKVAAKHAALQQEHNALRKTHVEYKSRVRAISTKIASRASKAATRKVAGLAGEAVPFAGVALAMAFTTVDLIETCEVLRDLEQIADGDGGLQQAVTNVCATHVPTTSQIIEAVARNWRSAYQAARDNLPKGITLDTPDSRTERFVHFVFR